MLSWARSVVIISVRFLFVDSLSVIAAMPSGISVRFTRLTHVVYLLIHLSESTLVSWKMWHMLLWTVQ